MTTSLAVSHIDGKLWGQGARNRSVRDVAFDFVVVSWSFGSPPVEAAAVWHQSKKSGPNPWPALKPANKGHSTRRWNWANAPMQPPVLLSTTHQKGDKRDGLYHDEGSAAGGKGSCVAMHFVMYSTHLCSVSGQKVVCPQEQVHLVEYGTTRGNCAAGKSNPNCCI